MNMLLMSGSMSDAMQELLADYVDEVVELALPDADNTDTDGVDGQNLSIPQIDITNEKLERLGEEHMETIVLDSLFMILASPEYLVQR